MILLRRHETKKKKLTVKKFNFPLLQFCPKKMRGLIVIKTKTRRVLLAPVFKKVRYFKHKKAKIKLYPYDTQHRI